MTTPTCDHNRVTPEGRAMGEQMARLTEPVIQRLAALGEPDARCKTCAFRAGTVPNGCLQTQLDVFKSVMEQIPFGCHTPGGEPNGKVCHGWYAAYIATRHAPPTPVPWPMSVPDELHAELTAQGYTDIVQMMGSADAPLCAIRKMLYTWAIVVGLTAEGYERRYCYEHEADARAALGAWHGEGHPGGPWIKCKGVGIDLLNPELRA